MAAGKAARAPEPIEARLVRTPRETAGARADRNLQFQKHFAMSRMLAAHSQGLEYTAYFDHQDDLVFVEHSEAESVSFYQVKARDSGTWSPKQLARRGVKGDRPKSIVGKAYDNIHRFGPGITRAAIISNQMLTAKHADGANTTVADGEIVLGDLSTADWDAIAGALIADFDTPDAAAAKSLLTFERIALDPFSFVKTLKGEVMDFADAVGGGAPRAALPIYESLLSEISRCTGDTIKSKTLQELKARKAVTRAQLDGLVARVQARSETPMEWWADLSTDLDRAGLAAVERKALRLECIAYWNARRSGNRAALALSKAIREAIADQPTYAEGPAMTAVAAYAAVGDFPVPDGEPYGQRGAILVELMERGADD